jgi:TM2 domain-containing membrane protein YozV
MEILIWTGVALAVLIFWFAWSMCRAAKRIDEAFDALDREIEQRGNHD